MLFTGIILSAVAGLGLVTALFISMDNWFILTMALMLIGGLVLAVYTAINQSRLDP